MILVLSAALAAAPLGAHAGPHAAQVAQYGDATPVRLASPRPARAARAAPPPNTTRARVYGYHPYWGDDPTELDFARLTDLAIFNVDVNSDGTLSSTSRWTSVAGEVVPLAHAHGVRVDLCVTSFSSSVHSSVLPSASRRATLIAELKELVDAYGADGVNVDFEGLSSSNRDYFTTFIAELAAAVGEVTLATPAVDWSRAFDYERLSDLSVGLFIMGYGYHWTGGDPGPNDPLFGGGEWGQYALDWTIADYLDHGADRDKIILGLPLYGQEWPASQSVPGTAYDDGWSVEMYEAVDIAAAEGRSYDSLTRSPYVLRGDTQLWYDDPASVQERIHWAVTDQGIGGVGFWALGYEGDDPAFWDMVEAESTIVLPDDTGGDSGGADSGGTDSGGTDDGDTDSADPDGDTGPLAQATVERGGGCSTRGSGEAGWGLTLGALALLARRRR